VKIFRHIANFFGWIFSSEDSGVQEFRSSEGRAENRLRLNTELSDIPKDRVIFAYNGFMGWFCNKYDSDLNVFPYYNCDFPGIWYPHITEWKESEEFYEGQNVEGRSSGVEKAEGENVGVMSLGGPSPLSPPVEGKGAEIFIEESANITEKEWALFSDLRLTTPDPEIGSFMSRLVVRDAEKKAIEREEELRKIIYGESKGFIEKMAEPNSPLQREWAALVKERKEVDDKIREALTGTEWKEGENLITHFSDNGITIEHIIS
jgi:hypothetical protein